MRHVQIRLIKDTNGLSKLLGKRRQLKINRGKGPKWVHTNRCKLYRDGGNDATTAVYAAPTGSDNENDAQQFEENAGSETESEYLEVDGAPSKGQAR